VPLSISWVDALQLPIPNVTAKTQRISCTIGVHALTAFPERLSNCLKLTLTGCQWNQVHLWVHMRPSAIVLKYSINSTWNKVWQTLAAACSGLPHNATHSASIDPISVWLAHVCPLHKRHRLDLKLCQIFHFCQTHSNYYLLMSNLQHTATLGKQVTT